jgi:hypothetical protein
MSDEVRARVFEPFYTTKEIGKGSGLGLSQAYGFAQQSGGTIAIESAPNKGTTVTFRLPVANMQAEPAREPRDRAPDARESGTILVIEDDLSLAAVTAALIEDSGFTVKVAHSAAAAIDLLTDEENGRIDAVFSGIVMPGHERRQRARSAANIRIGASHDRLCRCAGPTIIAGVQG